MPFPGNRHTKWRLPIKAATITGELNFDLPILLTHDIFPASAITLGGEWAMAQGGADLAFSTDAAGEQRLAAEVVFCTLDANPANSFIEIRVRVPNSHISDTIDSDLYVWWGDATEVLPADNEPYGKHDVWNGTTGDGTPIITYASLHFSEAPSDPIPPFKDSSGLGHHAQSEQTGNPSLAMKPGRGIGLASNHVWLSSGWSPGTGDFSWFGIFNEAPMGDGHAMHPFTSTIFSAGDNRVYLSFGSVNWNFGLTDLTGPICVGMMRDGDNAAGFANNLNASATGLASVDQQSSELDLSPSWASGDRGLSDMLLLNCAPNVYWARALFDCVRKPLDFFDTSYEPESSSVAAEIVFDGLNEGSEVRIYEEPHPQVWTLDLEGATYADILGEYATFSIQGESATSDHYVYWGTDPALAGCTGHAVALASGDDATAIATKTTAALAAIPDLDATRSGSLIAVTCERIGECATPSYVGTEGVLRLIQVGGASMAEITGIESSTGTSWTGTYSILRPRRAVIQIIHRNFKIKRYSTILQTAGLSVPAGALQVEDANYYNPD